MRERHHPDVGSREALANCVDFVDFVEYRVRDGLRQRVVGRNLRRLEGALSRRKR
jgi:hypothetical protein